jgi:cell division protein FtsW
VALVLLVAFGLVSVWIPGLADVAHKGSSRWIRLGPIQIQPSEFVRVAVCILYARWCSDIRRHNEYFWRGVILPLVALLPVLVLFVKQPDYGSTILVLVVVLAILYAAGAKFGHILLIGLLGIAVLGVGLFADPEHRSRITSVYASESADADDTHQINASLKAFRRGGFNGVGYGDGRMKEGHLPEAHTDFILAMTGEELGLRVTLLVVAGNLLLLFGGWQISRHCTDRFGKVLAFGLALHLCLAAAANIAVVTKFAPTKGLALPFMSYGGSNMLASSVVLGLLISIGRNGETGFAHKPILLGR